MAVHARGYRGVCYSGYLLYRGIPNFLGITEDQGFIFSGSTFAIGVLVLSYYWGLPLSCGAMVRIFSSPAVFNAVEVKTFC